MLPSMRKSLKVLDFYQAVPTEMSQGTISGACISIVSILVLLMLTIYLVVNFMQPQVISDLIIDQKHLSEKLKVNVDIEFPRFPCSLLSLDIENVLKVHLVNVDNNNNLQKIVLPEGVQTYNDKQMAMDEKIARITKDINEKKGCRMKGFFEIDRVPGNFHFSCHGYASVVPTLINQGHRNFDLSHKINELSFGQDVDYGRGGNSLGSFNSQKLIEDNFMGITYTYFLDIIENNEIDVNSQKTKQNYLYTARLNEVILAQFPMLLFRYETNPMTVLKIYEYQQWHTFFIDFIGVLGGIFTVSAIIDSMVHSSIKFLIQKHKQGKLI